MNRAARTAAAVLAVALLIALPGCSPSPKDADPASVPDAAAEATSSPAPTRTLVFDMGHREIFGPDDTTDLGQSRAIEQMRAAGFDVVVNTDDITTEDLKGASGLMLAGPMIPLKDSEYDTITDFAEQGGTVLMTIHVPFPVLRVPAHWGLPVEPYILMSETPYAGEDPSVFPATVMAKSRLTEGVESIAVVSGWPVTTAHTDSEYVIKTDGNTWVDGNDNKLRDAGEKAEYGVVAARRVGEGYIIVVGDDAVFANIAIGQPGNARLLDNILELMRGSLDV